MLEENGGRTGWARGWIELGKSRLGFNDGKRLKELADKAARAVE
jgi:hypothetical protein